MGIEENDNPILSVSHHIYPQTNLTTNHNIEETGSSKTSHESILDIIISILTYTHIYNLFTMLSSYISKLTINEKESHNNVIVEPKVEPEKESDDSSFLDDSINDSDLQIIQINQKITNDYHILKNQSSLNQPFYNSILEFDNEQIPTPPPAPLSQAQNNQELSSLVFHNLLNKRLKSYSNEKDSVVKDQYGTNLNLSSAYVSIPERAITEFQPDIINIEDEDEDELEDELEHTEENILDINVDKLSPRISDYKKTVLNYYIPSLPISTASYSVLDNLIPQYYIDKVSSIYQNYHDSILSRVDKSRIESQSLIKPLTSNQLSKVYNAWNNLNQGVYASHFQIELYNHDLTTLRDGKWLNDNIIDYYMNLIIEKSNHKVFGWTTHFFSTLEEKGYSGIVRWGKRKKLNLFEKDLIMVPINVMNTHWALAVINNKSHSIEYYDSLISSNGNIRAISLLKDYVEQEANRLNKKISSEYQLFPRMRSPQQANGYDCGVFTCTAAKYLSFNQPLRYSQNDMKNIRRRMTFEIMSNELLE
ncbi:uncharacterized protein RJT21DRAFT_12130 [Scheffersomyces amazonensis]|uniref:uncharacterized protein n=1 Tax=Scheffersomyces amazonensis TaxID=1078765 RepID=UPI00315DEE91